MQFFFKTLQNLGKCYLRHKMRIHLIRFLICNLKFSIFRVKNCDFGDFRISFNFLLKLKIFDNFSRISRNFWEKSFKMIFDIFFQKTLANCHRNISNGYIKLQYFHIKIV